MKTWVKTFRFEFFKDIDSKINEYCQKRNLTPLSISITTNMGIFYVVVVVTKESEVAKRREDIEKSPVDSLTPSVTDSKGEGK